MPSVHSKKELKELRQLKKRIAAAETALAEATAAGHIRNIAGARREIAAANKQMAAIREKAAGRKENQSKAQADTFLEEIKTKFPPLAQSNFDWGKKISGEPQPEAPQEPHVFTIEELADEISKTKGRLQSLGSEEKWSVARKYLLERVDALRAMLGELKNEESAALEQEEQEQANRDFLAAEADVVPLREKFYSRLASGFLPLDIREQARQQFLKLAASNRGKQSQASDTLQDGIHPAAVFKARADFYAEAAACLKVFEYDLNNEPPIHTLEGFDKDFWNSGRVVSPWNINFRGRTEKCLLLYCIRKYGQQTNNRLLLERLPDFPDPREFRVPNAQVPLEHLQRIEMEACLKALDPLHWESFETIYSVPTNSVENPHSKNLLLWADGREVQVGVEVLWDKRSNGYRRFPIPTALEPNWAMGGQRFEYEQNEYGDWVKVAVSNAPRESWSQDTAGNWKRDSSFNGDWALQPLLVLKAGDRKPTDDRTEFRYGHWFSKAECEQADKAQLNLRILTMPEGRGIADQIATERNSPLSEEESRNTWRRREKELEELKRTH